MTKQQLCVNWIRFTTLLTARIISTFFVPAMSGNDSDNSMIIDNSTFSSDRSKTVELLARVYGHARSNDKETADISLRIPGERSDPHGDIQTQLEAKWEIQVCAFGRGDSEERQ